MQDVFYLTEISISVYGSRVRYASIEKLPDGITGTRRTLDRMAEAVRGELPPEFRGYRHEAIRRLALDLVRGLPARDHRGELTRLFEFVRDRIEYRLDPLDTERLQDPLATLELGSGDCDDKVILLAALAASLGHLSRFVAQSADGQTFDHVYLEAETDRGWLALDPTADGQGGTPRAAPGWRNPTREEWIYQIW